MIGRSNARESFTDRREAGRELAARIGALRLDDPVVIALPRGGVPVAAEVAAALGAPLDITLVRKVGAPQNPEYGVGAIADDGQLVLDAEAISALGIGRTELQRVVERERAELDRRRRLYRGDREPIAVQGRTVVLVDDGLATGGTAVAAARALRSRHAAQVMLAVPVCPRGIEQALAGEFDEIVCLLTPRHFGGVGRWYRDFSPTSDSEVIEVLTEAPNGGRAHSPVSPDASSADVDAGAAEAGAP